MTPARQFPRRRWLLVTVWLIANVIGFGLVGALFHNFPLAFSLPPDLSGLWRLQLAPALIGGVLFGFTPALLIGLAQWAVLRPLLTPSRWWILTVSAGMGLQHFLDDGILYGRDRSLIVLLAAGLTGYLQLRLLRRQLAAPRWWLAAATGGWLLGWLLSIALLNSLGLIQRAWVPGLDGQQHGLQGLVVGAVYGGLTGLLLLRAELATARPNSTTVRSSQSPESTKAAV